MRGRWWAALQKGDRQPEAAGWLRPSVLGLWLGQAPQASLTRPILPPPGPCQKLQENSSSRRVPPGPSAEKA